MSKKYASLSTLQVFLDNLKTIFSDINHKHAVSDLEDYVVDNELSATSTNPVQNKVIDAEFEAMANAMNALDAAIDGKADSGHTHDDRYYIKKDIDDKIDAVNANIDTHNTSNTAHNDIRELVSSLDTKVNNFLDVDDTTKDQLSEVLTLISDNKGTLDDITSNKVNKSDVVDNLETTTEGKVLSANQGNVLQNQITEINSKLADLMYEAITIPSFSVSSLTSTGTGGTFTKSPVELGTTVTSVTLTWSTSKSPSALTLDGVAIDATKKSHTYSDLSLKDSKTYTLKATDERGAAPTKTTTLTFCNRVCYGAAAAPDTINSDFVMSLATRNLATSRTNNSVKYNAGEGQYLWYCVPTRLGQCSFTDVETGLGAGLSLVDTISVTNASGYTENYYVYKSDYAGLGSLTVKVS